MTYSPHFIRILVFISLLLLNSVALTSTWVERREAGEFMQTANEPRGQGALTRIEGRLTDLGGMVDDIDMYRIFVFSPVNFSVVASGALSVDNDAQLFLFDADGELIATDDDGLEDDDDLQPEFFTGVLSNSPAGYYYLAYNLFSSKPTLSSGTSGRLAGWARNPAPFQTGSYTLFLSGVLYEAPRPIDAGPDQQVTAPGPVTLNGLQWGASPQGYFGWYMTQGPGVVTFSDPRAAQTTATFSQPGQYTLLFWIYQGGIYPITDEVIITVAP